MDYDTHPLTKSYYTTFALRARGSRGGFLYVGRGNLTEHVEFAFISESQPYMKKVASLLKREGLEDVIVDVIHTEKPKDYLYIERCSEMTQVGSNANETAEENDACPMFARAVKNPDTGEIMRPMEVMSALERFNPETDGTLAPKWLCESDPLVVTKRDTTRDIKSAWKAPYIRNPMKTM